MTTSEERVRRCDALTLWTQRILGIFCYLFFLVPYLRETRGLDRLSRKRHYLFVSNHVSLLDTILLGGIFWRRRFVPILVLGDAAVWRETWMRRFLSARLGFLIDRDRATKGRIEELESFGRSQQDFHLVVFPEGTRGGGVRVRRCQPGVSYVARAAAVPMVPVFIEGMQNVSSKKAPFSPIKGLRKIRVHFGEAIPAETLAAIDREEFPAFVRQQIQQLVPVAELGRSAAPADEGLA
jgi:1-acyl-sn-glycerol-3-phosphate acyltransferase